MGTQLPNKKIPINAIKISKLHWSLEIDKEDIAKLAENIERHKLFHPITVREVSGKKGVYELLGGERRFRAVKKLGDSHIDCRVVRCDDDEARAISVNENIQRRQLTAAKLKEGIRIVFDYEKALLDDEEAKKQARRDRIAKKDPEAAAIFTTRGKNSGRGRPKSNERQAINKTAEKVGVSPSKVDEVVKQGKLIPTAKRALERGAITEKQAYKLAGKAKATQQDMLGDMTAENKEAETNKKRQEQLKRKGGPAEKAAVKLFERLMIESEKVYSRIDGLSDGLTASTMEAIIDMNRDPLIHLFKKTEAFLQMIERAETEAATKG